MPGVILGPMTKRLIRTPVNELDIRLLMRSFNVATTNTQRLRKTMDIDRHYVGFAKTAKVPERQVRIVWSFLDFFSADRKPPHDVKLQRLGWEIVTAIDPEQTANKKAAEDLASFLLQRIKDVREGLEWYQYYTSYRKTSGPINQLFKHALEGLAQTEPDKAEVAKIF